MKNDTFDIKRFCHYAQLHYWNNRALYLGAIIGASIILFGNLCSWGFLIKTTEELSYNPTNYILTKYTTSFCLLGAAFIFLFSSKSLTTSRLSAHPTMSEMLIPISTFERYIFSLVNSLVVAPLIFILIFTLVGNLAETRYMFSDDGYAYLGLFQRTDFKYITENYHHLNFFTFENMLNKNASNCNEQWNIGLMIFLGATIITSITMWSNITFKRYGALLGVGFHILVIIILANIIGKINSEIHQAFYNRDIRMPMLVRFSPEDKIFTRILLTLNIITITYQWVIWKKFKKVSIK